MPSALDALAEAALLQSAGDNAQSAGTGSPEGAFSARSGNGALEKMGRLMNGDSVGENSAGNAQEASLQRSSDRVLPAKSGSHGRLDVDRAQQRVVETLCHMASSGSKKVFRENGYSIPPDRPDQETGMKPSEGRSVAVDADVGTSTGLSLSPQRQHHREQALRAANEFGYRDHDGEITRCPCGSGAYQGFMLACESCGVWQHGKCMGIRRAADAPDQYFCEICRPDLVRPQCIIHGSTGTKASKKNGTTRGKRLAADALSGTDSKSNSNHSSDSIMGVDSGTNDRIERDPNDTVNSVSYRHQRSSGSTDVSSVANGSADDFKHDAWPAPGVTSNASRSAKVETSSPRDNGQGSPKRSRNAGSKGATPAASPEARSQSEPNASSLWSPQSPNAGLSREERKLQQIMQQFQRMEAEEERRRRREAEQHLHGSSSPSMGVGSVDSNAAMTTATNVAKSPRALSSPKMATQSEPESKRARGQVRHNRAGTVSGAAIEEVNGSREDAETTSSNRRGGPGRCSPSPQIGTAGNGTWKPSHRFARAEGSSAASNGALPVELSERNASSGDLPANSRSFSGLSCATAAENGLSPASPVPLRIPLPPSLSASLLGNIYVTSASTESAQEGLERCCSSNQETGPRASPLASSSWLALHQNRSSPEGGGFLPNEAAPETPHSARFGKKVWLLHQHYQEQLACLVDQPSSNDQNAPAVESLPDHLERLRLRVQHAARFSTDPLYASLPVKKKTAAAFRFAGELTVSAPDSA